MQAHITTHKDFPVIRGYRLSRDGLRISQVVQKPDLNLRKGAVHVRLREHEIEGTYHITQGEAQPLSILGIYLDRLKPSLSGISGVEVSEGGRGGQARPSNIRFGFL